MPLMIIISGPSGVGKDSVLRALKKGNLPIHHVVTANTRKPRKGEIEGVDYFFVTKENFKEMIRNDELIEYSKVYQDYKGVPKSEVRKAIKTNKDIIFRLDVQGAEKLKTLYPYSILIFLIPSSQKDWYKRLGERRLSKEKDLDMRIKTVRAELKKIFLFDYIVVNAQNKLSETVKVIESIITAEHHKTRMHKINL
ncbi:MAG: guanylate kinase [Anaerolineaceae bacterium]|nr:guanylate kinase [Anaerolineaceae bacterium]